MNGVAVYRSFECWTFLFAHRTQNTIRLDERECVNKRFRVCMSGSSRTLIGHRINMRFFSSIFRLGAFNGLEPSELDCEPECIITPTVYTSIT